MLPKCVSWPASWPPCLHIVTWLQVLCSSKDSDQRQVPEPVCTYSTVVANN
jgi:hypothetical protein